MKLFRFKASGVELLIDLEHVIAISVDLPTRQEDGSRFGRPKVELHCALRDVPIVIGPRPGFVLLDDPAREEPTMEITVFEHEYERLVTAWSGEVPQQVTA